MYTKASTSNSSATSFSHVQPMSSRASKIFPCCYHEEFIDGTDLEHLKARMFVIVEKIKSLQISALFLEIMNGSKEALKEIANGLNAWHINRLSDCRLTYLEISVGSFLREQKYEVYNIDKSFSNEEKYVIYDTIFVERLAVLNMKSFLDGFEGKILSPYLSYFVYNQELISDRPGLSYLNDRRNNVVSCIAALLSLDPISWLTSDKSWKEFTKWVLPDPKESKDELPKVALNSFCIDEDLTCRELKLLIRDRFSATKGIITNRSDSFEIVERSLAFRPLLHLAATIGNAKAVELLLSRKVNVNTLDRYGTSALQYAMIHNHFFIVRLLLDNGATIINFRPRIDFSNLSEENDLSPDSYEICSASPVFLVFHLYQEFKKGSREIIDLEDIGKRILGIWFGISIESQTSGDRRISCLYRKLLTLAMKSDFESACIQVLLVVKIMTADEDFQFTGDFDAFKKRWINEFSFILSSWNLCLEQSRFLNFRKWMSEIFEEQLLKYKKKCPSKIEFQLSITPLFFSTAEADNLEALKVIIGFGTNVNYQKDTIIHDESRRGPCSKYKQNPGYTALHYAVNNLNVEMVKALLMAGANPKIRDGYRPPRARRLPPGEDNVINGMTPLDHARQIERSRLPDSLQQNVDDPVYLDEEMNSLNEIIALLEEKMLNAPDPSPSNFSVCPECYEEVYGESEQAIGTSTSSQQLFRKKNQLIRQVVQNQKECSDVNNEENQKLLKESIRQGDIADIQTISESGVNLYESNQLDYPLLKEAIEYDQVDVVKYLTSNRLMMEGPEFLKKYINATDVSDPNSEKIWNLVGPELKEICEELIAETDALKEFSGVDSVDSRVNNIDEDFVRRLGQLEAVYQKIHRILHLDLHDRLDSFLKHPEFSDYFNSFYNLFVGKMNSSLDGMRVTLSPWVTTSKPTSVRTIEYVRIGAKSIPMFGNSVDAGIQGVGLLAEQPFLQAQKDRLELVTSLFPSSDESNYFVRLICSNLMEILYELIIRIDQPISKDNKRYSVDKNAMERLVASLFIRISDFMFVEHHQDRTSLEKYARDVALSIVWYEPDSKRIVELFGENPLGKDWIIILPTDKKLTRKQKLKLKAIDSGAYFSKKATQITDAVVEGGKVAKTKVKTLFTRKKTIGKKSRKKSNASSIQPGRFMPRKILTDRGCFQRAPLLVDGLGYILPKKCRFEDYFVIRLNELDGAHILAMTRKVGRFQLNQSGDIAACLKTRSYREWFQTNAVPSLTEFTSTGVTSSSSAHSPTSSSSVLAASSTITLIATPIEIASPHDLLAPTSSSGATSSTASSSYQGVSQVPNEISGSLEGLYRDYGYFHQHLESLETEVNHLIREQCAMKQEFAKWGNIQEIQRLIKRIPQFSDSDRKKIGSTVIRKIVELRNLGLTKDEEEGLIERLNRAMAKVTQSSISSTISLASSSSSSSKERGPSHVDYLDVKTTVVTQPAFQGLATQHQELVREVSELKEMLREQQRKIDQLKQIERFQAKHK